MDVAERTEKVYNHVSRLPTPSFAERIWRQATVGAIAGWICCFTVAVLYLIWRFLEFLSPREDIEMAPEMFVGAAPSKLRKYEIEGLVPTHHQRKPSS
jgi:phosphatidylinositol glycan class A protein